MGKKIKINKGKWEANKPPSYIVQQLASVSIDSDIDRINQALDDVAYSSSFAYSSIDAELKKAYELVEELCYYIDGTMDDIENHIDEPFFEAFDNNTGILEQFEKINLDDYKTKNTLDITETIQTGEYDYRGSTYKSVSYTKELKEVGFSDLFNNMDVTGYGGMPSFAEMMKEQYKNALSNPEMTASYKEYVEAVLHRSDIQHSVDKGGWNTVSDVLDIVGIVSLVSVFTGTDFLTQEILTDAERDAAGINTAINIALLGVTVFTAGVGSAGYLSKAGMSITAKAVVKDLAVDMVSGLASLGTINLLDAAGSPEWLSMLAGLTVSVTGGYYGSKAVNSIGKGASGAEMPEISSNFNYKSKYAEVEFTTQLKNQEKGLNDLTISEFVENRKKFNKLGRSKEASKLQKELREQFLEDKISELRTTGMSRSEAKLEAEKWMKTQAVLHDPDQIAGGNPLNLTGLGDKNINSSIGSQWRYRIDDLEKQIMDFANTIPQSEWGNVKLNIKLTY